MVFFNFMFLIGYIDTSCRISEGLLEDLIKEVSKEVEEICDNYVEDVYAHEFVKDTG